eukprot:7991583-Pyramimonas_sp.AAC.1
MAGRFQNVALAMVPRTLPLDMYNDYHWLSWLTYQKSRLGTIRDCQDTTVTLIRGAEVPGTAFWH